MDKNNQSIYDLCKQHLHAYVLVETKDGMTFDGIMTGLDDENVYFAVPIEPYERDQIRNIYSPPYAGPYGGFDHPYYGYPGYGYPGRRFRRLVIPLAALTTLALLPWY